MKPPVESGGLPAGAVTVNQLATQMQQMRTAINRVLQRTIEFTTTGGGPTPIWVDPDDFPRDAHATVTAIVMLSNDDGTKYGKWERTAVFVRPAGAGNAAIVGAMQDRHPAIVGGGAYDLSIVVAANVLEVVVDDAGDAGLDVNAWIEVRKG